VSTVAQNVTSYESAPGLGTHSYCVSSFNTAGVSNPCCTFGTQSKVVKPSPCSITGSVSLGTAAFHWSPSARADGYHVYEDGLLVATVAAISYPIPDQANDHEYCVEAFAAGYQTSDQCCQTFHGNPALPLGVSPCQASSDRVGGILLTWTNVEFESGYVIQRDGHVLAGVPADTTRFLDNTLGFHTYCVQAINSTGSGPACCADGIGLSPAMRARLSWGTCAPQVGNQNFAGPGVYTLVLSVEGSATTNVGHDSELRIRPAVPDAWRFDDAGCQTGSGLNLSNPSLGDSCPAMLGANPLAITSYAIDLDGSAMLRLAIVYDDLTTLANQRYVLWKIAFDHTHSIAGTDADPSTCDGASSALDFTVIPQILLTNGIALAAAMEPNDVAITWNGGSGVKTRVQATTWGRMKALYR